MMTTILLLALGETYLTQEQALRLVFPNGETVVDLTVEIEESVRHAVEDRCGAVAARHRIFVGSREGRITGYAMIHTEITKTLPATFIVGVGAAGEVTEVAVMSHEDHIGVDCRKERFLQQFDGKTHRHALRVGSGSGVLPVSGATLSCNAVARAVRRTVAIVQLHFLEKPENAASLLRPEDPVRQKRYLMGAFLEITAYGEALSVEHAFEAVKRVEKAISNYDEKSELSRLHRERSIEAGPELLAFVRESIRFARETEEAFDITVAPLVRLWGFKDGKHRVPSDQEIAAALRTVGSAKVAVDGRAVTLTEGTELDPGAIGKGMGVDAAVGQLRKAGVSRALVDFGSTVYALGSWEVAIRDPYEEGKTLGVMTLENESLSTSGGYEQFFDAGGRRYGHILDPRTGRPVQGIAAVSVVAPTGMESDAMSTATFVLGKLPGRLPAVIARSDKEIESNESFRKKLQKGGP
jgi:thiamine biosynthesis lipoprotein ApbE/Na+-translocating ferredoxin:NAD+ oxidoreductase RnfG subunit